MTEAADSGLIDLWARFVRVSQAVLAAVEGDLKAAGLPPLSWYDALLELRRAGPEGLRPFELQRHMLLAQYSVSRLIDRLERAGLATTARAPEDARGQRVRITPEGRDLLGRMWPAYRGAIMDRFADRLEPGDAEALAAILDRLRPA